MTGALALGVMIPSASALPGDLVYNSTIKGEVYLPYVTAVAKDVDGNYYALRNAGYGVPRVVKYDSNHHVLLEFGEDGTGMGQIGTGSYSAWGIYVGPDNNIYIADGGNHYIKVFDQSGNFVREFGGLGTADGQLSIPYGVAFDSEGNIWVADRGNRRIQKYDSTGNFLMKFGSLGAASGQFNNPNAITIDANDDIYISDRSNNRLQKFDKYGNFILQFGTGVAGAADGQLNQPTFTLVDPGNGDVYTYEINNRRISVFSSTGIFLRNFSVELPGLPGNHRSFSMVWDNGNITLAVQAGAYKLQTVTKAGVPVSTFNGDRFDAYQIIPTITYGAIDPLVEGGRLFITDGQSGRIVTFDGVSRRYLTDMRQASRTYVTAVTSDVSGNIYVLDYSGLHKYGQDGTYIEKILEASDTGYNLQAGDVVVDGSGNIWITGSGTNSQVRKFSPSGTLLATIGSYGAGDDQLDNPTSILLTQTELYVVDGGNNRVQVLGHDGNYIRQFGSSGSGNGEFDQPYGIAVDDKDNIYVSDRGNSRVQKFAANGVYLTQFGSQGSGNNEFNTPMGLTFADGKIYVGDAGNRRVQVLSVAPDIPSEPIDVGLRVSRSAITISWEAPADDGGSPITQYTIRYRLTSASTWTVAGTTDGSVLSATVTGLPIGNYEIQVFASNAAGDGLVATSSVVAITADDEKSDQGIGFTPGAPNTGINANNGMTIIITATTLLTAGVIGVIVRSRRRAHTNSFHI